MEKQFQITVKDRDNKQHVTVLLDGEVVYRAVFRDGWGICNFRVTEVGGLNEWPFYLMYTDGSGDARGLGFCLE